MEAAAVSSSAVSDDADVFLFDQLSWFLEKVAFDGRERICIGLCTCDELILVFFTGCVVNIKALK